MQRQLFIAILAGATAVVLFTIAIIGPAATRLLFFVFTPLPVFVAGLRAGWIAAAVATLTATTLTVLAFSSTPVAGLTLAITQLVPATLLCYFASLSRPDPTPPAAASQTPEPHKPNPQDTASQAQENPRQWYPLGSIILWATAAAIVLSVAVLALIAPDMDALKVLLRERLDSFLDASLPSGETAKSIPPADREHLTELTLYLLPGALTIWTLATLLLNFWLAGHITRAAGQLERPWPDLAAITYPRGTPLALAASLLAAWTLTGLPGLAASAAAGGLFFAYMLLGLAVIHYVTRNKAWRTFILVAVYMSLIVINSAFWVLIVLIGLAEPISPLQRRFAHAPKIPPDNEN